jgi:hypothetical protein
VSEYKLMEEIIRRSQANTWDVAKLEWTLEEIYRAEEFETCLCDHFPIIEICVLRNKLNKDIAEIGNCCIKKFIGLPSKIFQAIKRIRRDIKKSLNSEAIQYAFDHGWFNQWEKDFYLDVMRKRNLSSKQIVIKMRVNKNFLLRFSYERKEKKL